VQKIEDEIGAIDILVNNAGIQRRNPLEEFKESDWHELINTNLNSVFYAAQAVARHMIPRGAARSSISARCRANWASRHRPYAATKGAVKMFTKGMAIDWGKYGIQVNGLGRATSRPR
jgi:gluconate 5-dehydrogenase